MRLTALLVVLGSLLTLHPLSILGSENAALSPDEIKAAAAEFPSTHFWWCACLPTNQLLCSVQTGHIVCGVADGKGGCSWNRAQTSAATAPAARPSAAVGTTTVATRQAVD